MAASSPTHATRLATATRLLTPVTETPRLDAEILLAHALGLSRTQLLARLQETADLPSFEVLLQRRLECEPIAYILGEWEFFSLDFEVTPPLLVPRPETEHLVETVIEFVGETPARLFEIGVGTGCVSISIAKHLKHCRILGSDINPVALEVATRNAERHGVTDRFLCRSGSLFDVLTPEEGSLDVVFSNPPYVAEGEWDTLPPVIRRHEDPKALLAGTDGLDIVRTIIIQAQNWLRAGGLLAMEIGDTQHEAVRDFLTLHAYTDIRFVNDLAGIPRIACACKIDKSISS